MSSWLTGIELVLVIVGLVLGYLWWNSERREYALGGGAALALAIGLWSLGWWLPSDENQIKRKVNDMAAGIASHNLDRFFEHVSDGFHLGGYDKRAFRLKVDEAVRTYGVHDMTVWEVQVENLSREKRTADVSFNVKVRGNWSEGREFWLVHAHFVLDPDNQWRMVGFELSNPFVNTDQPVAIPGF